MSIRNSLCVLALLAAAPAFAGLGSAPTPSPAPAATAGVRAMAAQQPTTPAGYTINEIYPEAGGVIREYVSPAGVVFGVSWRSPIMPDLHDLLGEYFPAFEQAAVASRATGRRGPLAIDSDELVLQSGGQMRDYRGRAYAPGLLPPNVSAEIIK